MEDEDYSENDGYEPEEGSNSWLVTILIIALVWALFFHKQKYEGQTAEEWFNDYDEAEIQYEQLKNCVEDYAYSDNYDDLTSIQYNCL